MNLFRRRPKPAEPLDLNARLDDAVVRQVAALVNAGKVNAADRLCNKQPYPRETAFAAFRYIDVVEA
ncbi:hypothetical protein ACIPXV_09500 [Streptomyces libani]|uniref:hypothetical protein n=1 Tax=Streptomyces nigrescens TaxID=1920 RepID=UPI0038191944